MIPPYQPPGAVRKHITPTIDRKTHILDFISPVSNLTSLRDSPSTQVSLVTSCCVEVFRFCPLCTSVEYLFFQSQLLSPLTGQTCSDTRAGVPKKLFTEPEPSNPQDNMDELLGLCSGQFTGRWMNCENTVDADAVAVCTAGMGVMTKWCTEIVSWLTVRWHKCC